MASTTNFGWSTPDNSGLVKDGAQDIRTLGSAIDTSMGELKGGTTGQVLSKTSATDMDFTWATPSGGGGSMTVLATGSITSNTLSLTGFPTDYKDIRIIISSLRGYGRARVNPYIYPASNPSAYYTVSEIITTSYNNGASATIGNYYGDGSTQMRFSYNPTTGDTDSFSGNAYRTSAVINIYNNDVTSYAKLFDCTLQGWNSSGGASEVLQTNGTAYLQTSSEVDRIDGLGFNFGLDGSQSGTYTVYGIK